MSLSFLFARRYLISKKSSNAVNIIAWVSMVGVAVGALGLIIVLSVFNGFEGLVISLYNSFNPDFTITAREGKSFVPDSALLKKLEGLEGIRAVTPSVEENVLLTYGDNQQIATLKGVNANYGELTGIDSSMFNGEFILQQDQLEYAVLGVGIEQSLGVNYSDPFGMLSVYMPKKDAGVVSNPADAFNRESIRPSGSFAIQSEFDSKYLFVPIDFARKLTGYEREISSLEVAVNPGADVAKLQSEIEALFGNTFITKNRLQQNETLYRVMKTEKWAVYAVLTFILIIASFNIVGSLSMLVIEKRKDISILKAMGSDNRLIRRIFLSEGLLLSLIGCLSGFMIALLIIVLQQQFGFLRMSGSFVIEYYPVEMKLEDFLLVFFTVVIIGGLAAWFPAHRAAQTELQIAKE